MRQTLRGVVASWLGLGMLLFTAGVAGIGAQEQFTFFLSATGQPGEPVTDLRPEDIVVAEDGRPATVVSMVPVAWPVRVTVLVDNGFETGALLTQYRTGLKAFFSALPPGVEASLLTLAPQPRWVVRPTRDRDQLLKGADSVSPDRSAPRFVDGLVEAANRIEQDNRKETAYFPVVVMVATTGPEGSGVQDRAVDRMASRLVTYAGRLHVIMLSVSASSNRLLGAAQVQVGKTVADMTGGRYEAIAAASRIPDLLAEYGQLISEAHAFQSRQYKVTAARPAGSKGPLGQLSTGPVRPGLRLIPTAQGLKP